jgi:hypothetical protein
VDLCISESEPDVAGVQEEAAEILATVRRRLAKRLAVAVVMNKQQLLGRGNLLASPLTCDRELAEMAASLCQVDHAIAAMSSRWAAPFGGGDTDTPGVQSADTQRRQTFSRFAQLVAEKRLEEASRELSRILHMPLDRAVTATHCFARGAEANPDNSAMLAVLHQQIATSPVADSIRLLMKTFGFQAVESRLAMETLKSKRHMPDRT